MEEPHVAKTLPCGPFRCQPGNRLCRRPRLCEARCAGSQRLQGQTAVEQRTANAAADLSAWWAGFGDPQLTRFVLLSLEQNLDLAQAFARVTQARAGLGAANAALLPSGNVTGQAARAYQSVETPLGRVLNSRPGFDRYGNAFEADVNASWELDVFGGLRRGREAALADYQASQAGAVATRLVVAAQTADIYITIRGLQTRLKVARHQVQTQEELLSTVNLLYGKGLAAELQVRQAEGALAQVRASIPQLEAGLDAAMNALDVMLGSLPGTHRAELAEGGDIPAARRLQLSDPRRTAEAPPRPHRRRAPPSRFQRAHWRRHCRVLPEVLAQRPARQRHIRGSRQSIRQRRQSICRRAWPALAPVRLRPY